MKRQRRSAYCVEQDAQRHHEANLGFCANNSTNKKLSNKMKAQNTKRMAGVDSLKGSDGCCTSTYVVRPASYIKDPLYGISAVSAGGGVARWCDGLAIAISKYLLDEMTSVCNRLVSWVRNGESEVVGVCACVGVGLGFGANLANDPYPQYFVSKPHEL